MIVEVYWKKVFEGTMYLSRTELAKNIAKHYPQISFDKAYQAVPKKLRPYAFGSYAMPSRYEVEEFEVRKSPAAKAKSEERAKAKKEVYATAYPDSTVVCVKDEFAKFKTQFTDTQKEFLKQHLDFFTMNILLGRLKEFREHLCVDGQKTFDTVFAKYREDPSKSAMLRQTDTTPKELIDFNNKFFGKDRRLSIVVGNGYAEAHADYKMRCLAVPIDAGMKVKVVDGAAGSQLILFERV